MPAWLQQVLLSGGVFTVLAGIAKGVAMWPKTRADANKSDTDANVALSQQRAAEQVETLRQTREAADRADRSRELAQRAEEVCLGEKRRVTIAFDTFINRMEQVVDTLMTVADTDVDVRARARTDARDAIREARESI